MTMKNFRLDGKVALITGGNRGIGLAVARLFGEAGAQCMLTSRSETPALKELLASAPDQFAWVQADVNDDGARTISSRRRWTASAGWTCW